MRILVASMQIIKEFTIQTKINRVLFDRQRSFFLPEQTTPKTWRRKSTRRSTRSWSSSGSTAWPSRAGSRTSRSLTSGAWRTRTSQFILITLITFQIIWDTWDDDCATTTSNNHSLIGDVVDVRSRTGSSSSCNIVISTQVVGLQSRYIAME